MANPYARYVQMQGAAETVGKINPYAKFAVETAANLAGNTFMDVGATGADRRDCDRHPG